MWWGVREEEDSSSEGELRVRELRHPKERQPPTWMGDFVSNESLLGWSSYSIKWSNEIKSIEKNQTWAITELSDRAKRSGMKWVYKANLVAKGYSQKHWMDYTYVLFWADFTFRTLDFIVTVFSLAKR